MDIPNALKCPCCGQVVEGVSYLADPISQTITNGVKSVRLTTQQFEVAQFLLESYPRVATKEAIYDRCFMRPTGEGPDMKIIDVRICHIRPLLAEIGMVIETVWGKGYRVVSADATQANEIKEASIRYREQGSAHRWKPEYDDTLKDLMSRRFSITQCATRMKLPYMAVERAWKRIAAAENA
ncbi:winged helix-turn-helix domain-containing protein [Sinorhizobium meliloti]|uniref:winged helix-turn-helix domain-containing protein n=1 Tax=Rhizobium meliloti TaxID=382 RepID=UPI0001E4AB5B|nr:winged helix-turn-helix domain-containing protein [Sinorhizobium meliloti]AEG53144.1 transcriptional regulator domain-containing protein [Sinorhizobium meliloti AK83]MDE4591141.1 winged helix-turn-helix domain-containing protein [Sinorhizobium meliloti]SEI56023.1 Transcriptional regulatory protein, C terminal [Sinorhizobium meliloti]